jgi:hypothetical protein
MRLAKNLTLLAAGALTLSACALGDAASDARKAIQGLYNTDNAAAMRKDVNAIFAHTTPDYVATDKQGKKHTVAEAKTQLPMVFSMSKSIKAVSKIKTFKLSGSTASCTVDESVTIQLQNPQNNQTATMSIEETNADTWTKTAKGWMKKTSKSLKEKRLMNGKPMNSMGAPGQ